MLAIVFGPADTSPRGDGRAVSFLVLTMMAVAVAFLSAIVYFESSGMRVRRETEGMLTIGVPCTERLTMLRMTLRQLDGSVDRALVDLMERRQPALDELRDVRRRLDAELAAYRLRAYPVEAGVDGDVDRELAALDGALARLIGELGAGHLQRSHALANADWRRQSDRVDDRLRALTGFNTRHLTEHALRIDQIRRRSAIVGLAVGGAAMLLAMTATLVAARAVRRQMRVKERRAAELEQFSARVAHDLMSPLASVALALELGSAEATSPEQARLIKRALSSARRMRAIVDGLFEFARSGGLPPAGARCDVNAVSSAAVDETRAAAERAGIAIASEVAAAGEVACSAGILTVLLSNLLNNALKFMGEARERQVKLQVEERGREVMFSVTDSGPGLPPGFEEHAFEPYVRAATTVPGLGLGLATVKRLVLAHGGRVGVTRLPTGTRFWLTLPRPAAADAARDRSR